MSGPTVTNQHQAPTAIAQRAILDLLLIYFCNSHINGTVANVPKHLFSEQDWTQGWIPIATIASFKRLHALTREPLDIALTASQLAPSIFEVSPDGLKLRRRAPFEEKEVALLSARDDLQKTCIEASGFSASTTVAEASAFFAHRGALASVTTGGAEGTFLVEYQDPENMVLVLASLPDQLVHEDQPIRVKGRSKVGYENTRGTAPRTLETHAGMPSRPRNRIVRFELASPAPTTAEGVEVKALMSKFASVHSVDLVAGERTGFVRLKASVAEQVVEVVKRQGGIVVNGDPV
ncbi:hypothetical protein HKX48_000918, partial [Thoreauomyces humboldtii]